MTLKSIMPLERSDALPCEKSTTSLHISATFSACATGHPSPH